MKTFLFQSKSALVASYVVLALIAIIAIVNEYLLPVAPWEAFLSWNWGSKGFVSLILIGLCLPAIIHLADFRKPKKESIEEEY